jgi:hypothetical protein
MLSLAGITFIFQWTCKLRQNYRSIHLGKEKGARAQVHLRPPLPPPSFFSLISGISIETHRTDKIEKLRIEPPDATLNRRINSDKNSAQPWICCAFAQKVNTFSSSSHIYTVSILPHILVMILYLGTVDVE